MRIWSLHPKYLDNAGLIAAWREGLLAQAVLAGRTKGYRNHPQMWRFQQSYYGERVLGSYLWGLACEARMRGYQFDGTKIDYGCLAHPKMTVTRGQLVYEAAWLEHKKGLRARPGGGERCPMVPDTGSCFVEVAGPIELWERPKLAVPRRFACYRVGHAG